MKKIFFVLMTMVIGGGTALGQLRVSNGYGQNLTVTINNETREIPNNGMQTFGVRSAAVTLKCQTANGQTFSVYKSVPRSGLILIEQGDNKNTVLKVATATTKTANTAQTVAVDNGIELPFIYKGKISFKIFSETGRGLEFFSDSTDGSGDGAYNTNLTVSKDNDLILGEELKTAKIRLSGHTPKSEKGLIRLIRPFLSLKKTLKRCLPEK